MLLLTNKTLWPGIITQIKKSSCSVFYKPSTIITKGIFKTYLKIIEEIGYSEAFSKAINFNPYLDVLTDSYYYKLDSNVGRLVDTVDAIDKGIAKCETLEEQVLYNELVAEVHGFHTSEMQIQVQALRNFKDFYQGMQKELDKLRQKYFDRVNGANSMYHARVRYDALKEFSMNVNLIQKVKDKLCEDMIIEKINVLKKFTADKYKQYLYKYLQEIRRIGETNTPICKGNAYYWWSSKVFGNEQVLFVYYDL